MDEKEKQEDTVYTDLDDMPQPPEDIDAPVELNDDIQIAARTPKPRKTVAAAPRSQRGASRRRERQAAKAAQKVKEERQIVVVVVLAFLLLFGALIGVGLMMTARTQPAKPHSERLPMAAGRTYFQNKKNRAELSPEGVKGAVTEAYYAENGALAVTMSLSNGREQDQKVTRLYLRIFNENQELIAERAFDSFDPEIVVQAGGYQSTYLVIDPSYVKITDDPLQKFTYTLEATASNV